MAAPQPLLSPRSEATRAALVRAALDLFGAKGFEATSTREIAAAASANIASIAYHFGGKEGLRRACADFVVAAIGEIFARAPRARPSRSRGLTPAAARGALALHRLAAMIDAIVVRDEARPIVRFVLREMFEPSAAFERLLWPRSGRCMRGLRDLVARDRRAGRKRGDAARRVRDDRARSSISVSPDRPCCAAWAGATSDPPKQKPSSVSLSAISTPSSISHGKEAP